MTKPNHNADLNSVDLRRPLNKAEQRVYENMKKSLEQIKLHLEGKIQLKDAKELLKEL
jgi:hypothetical protein